jgi:hypothetical protein
MGRGDVARIVVGVLIILFGLLFTPVTGFVLFISQLLSVLIIAAGIVLINFARLNRNLDKGGFPFILSSSRRLLFSLLLG